MKICSKCSEVKELKMFYKRKKHKDGYNTQCKSCIQSYEMGYRSENVDIVKKARDKYYKNNKDIYAQYYQNHKEKVSEYNKKYNSIEENIIKRRKYRKDEYDRKYGIDMQFTIALSIRNRTKAALKLKSDSTLKLLGCSIDEYYKYLEEQFDTEMSWDNYGTYWEIDHILPLYTFDLLLKENQKIAFNFKNTRPLSISKNRSRPRKQGI